MIQCKNACPMGKFNGCCRSCPDYATCKEVCEFEPADCGEATFDEDSALVTFQNTQLSGSFPVPQSPFYGQSGKQ